MNQHQTNKLAWEEAYENRKDGWEPEEVAERIRNQPDCYLEPELLEALDDINLKSATVAQFGCNNGRELLCMFSRGVAKGYGFDIAENMIQAAAKSAELLEMDCEFVATDIFEIGEEWTERFDMVLITVGAITWFEDLRQYFEIVARCLKQNGIVVLQDMHPITGMIGVKGEERYAESEPEKILYSYFRKEPWIETDGIGYMTGKSYSSKAFTSFSHTFSEVINAFAQNDLFVERAEEYDKDISELFDAIEGKGIPLSYLLIGRKKY
ncbi:MAG: class I SAM-dependent methyltransferase [Anaerofustis sp.]